MRIHELSHIWIHKHLRHWHAHLLVLLAEVSLILALVVVLSVEVLPHRKVVIHSHVVKQLLLLLVLHEERILWERKVRLIVSHISTTSVTAESSTATTAEILVSISHVSDLSGSMGKSTVVSVWTFTILSKELAFNSFEVVAEVRTVLLCSVSVVCPLSSAPLVLTVSVVLSVFVSGIHTIIILHVLTENIVVLRSLIWLVSR